MKHHRYFDISKINSFQGLSGEQGTLYKLK